MLSMAAVGMIIYESFVAADNLWERSGNHRSIVYAAIGVSVLLCSFRISVYDKIECMHCSKRYTRKAFLKTEGICSYCGAGYFVYFKTRNEPDSNPFSLDRMYMDKLRYKGEDLMRLFGSPVHRHLSNDPPSRPA
jgi:hypothetical protein